MLKKIVNKIYDYFDKTPMFGYFLLVVVIAAVVAILVKLGL